MSLDAELLESILGDELDATKAGSPILLLYNDCAARCAALLAEECLETSNSGRLYGESLVTALIAALFTSRKAPERTESGLSRWQLRQAMEYLEAHMTQDMNLEEMAHLVGLSQSQFARLFKISTGMPPYKWSLDARIKRAQELLLLGKDCIMSIAIQTGFADQSHFTKTFRRATGATPKDWQRSRKV